MKQFLLQRISSQHSRYWTPWQPRYFLHSNHAGSQESLLSPVGGSAYPRAGWTGGGARPRSSEGRPQLQENRLEEEHTTWLFGRPCLWAVIPHVQRQLGFSEALFGRLWVELKVNSMFFIDFLKLLLFFCIVHFENLLFTSVNISS